MKLTFPGTSADESEAGHAGNEKEGFIVACDGMTVEI